MAHMPGKFMAAAYQFEGGPKAGTVPCLGRKNSEVSQAALCGAWEDPKNSDLRVPRNWPN